MTGRGFDATGGGYHRGVGGTRVSAGTVSNLNQKVYEQIEQWRNRKLEGDYPYVFWMGSS